MKHVYITFYHGSGLIGNLMFNGSICFGLYLQILRFYLVGQICSYSLELPVHRTMVRVVTEQKRALS